MTYLKSGIALGVLVMAAGVAAPQETDNEAAETAQERREETIIVVGTDQSRYRIGRSDALTGFDLDFLENPRVVNVLPEQLILDRKITDLEEALRNTPGVSVSDGFGGTNDDFFLRGFRRNVVYRNGFRRETNFKTNLTNVEYTQVVRGPASITYGQVEPGGLVDIVTKKPLDERRVYGEARYGSYDDALLLLDWSQPVNDQFAIRIVASTQDAESFRDFTDIARDTVAISARYEPTTSTRLDFAYEYRDESRPLDRGTVTVPTPDGRAIVNNVTNIPVERRFGEPFEVFESEFNFYEATLTQDLGETWQLKVGAAYEDSLANDLQARPLQVLIFNEGAPITADGFFTAPVAPEPVFDDPSDLVYLARRTDGSRERDTQVFYLDGLLTGEVMTGDVRHQLSLGADYREGEVSRFFVTTPFTDGVPEELGGGGPLFNLRDPIYGNLPSEVSTEGRPLIEAKEETYGFFINDYVSLTDRLGLLIGARYDEVDSDGDGPLEPTDAISPQVGVTYKLAENASVFASYAESFQPNSVVNPESGENTPFDPERGEQIEFGAKARFFEERLQTTLTAYQIDKRNVLSSVDGVPVLREGQSSEGVELSVSGQPIQGMNIVAGYAYTDAEIKTGANAGNRPRNVAETTANLWVSYELQASRFEGLGVGAGVFLQGDRFGDDANTFKLGEYALADASVWYTLAAPEIFQSDGTIRLQLAVKNLFDEEYFPASGGNERISIGTPRTVFGSVAFTF